MNYNYVYIDTVPYLSTHKHVYTKICKIKDIFVIYVFPHKFKHAPVSSSEIKYW